MIDNDCGTNGRGPQVVSSAVERFGKAAATIRSDSAKGSFYLMGMAGSTMEPTLFTAWEIAYLVPLGLADKKALVKNCSSYLQIPNVTDFCPMSLQEKGQLANYYHQAAFDWVIRAQQKMLAAGVRNDSVPRFPNAIYRDVITRDGTFRTDNSLLDNGTTPAVRYSYVGDLLLSNINLACAGILGTSGAPAPPPQACSAALATVQALRAPYPLKRWNDLSTGRLADWPPTPPLP
jgi:hypothetical protein